MLPRTTSQELTASDGQETSPLAAKLQRTVSFPSVMPANVLVQLLLETSCGDQCRFLQVRSMRWEPELAVREIAQ